MCYHPHILNERFDFSSIILFVLYCDFQSLIRYISSFKSYKIILTLFWGEWGKGVKGGKFVSCSSQVFKGSPCEIEDMGGNILQTRIVEILEFPRCLLNISQGSMHNFNLISLAISIDERKEIHK